MQRKLTTSCRDKMLLERSNILNDYAKETSDRGTMYFVYSKSSSKCDSYNLCVCKDGMNHEVICVEKSKLPMDAGVDSVLRCSNGEYILDEDATRYILSKINKVTQKLLEEQTLELNKYRVDGNLYEVVEVSDDRVWLMNRDKNDGECFEEIDISKETLDNISAGDLVQYTGGEYRIVTKD